MKSAYFDCFMGASGDMFTGALLDAGADLDAIKAALHSLHLHGFEVSAEKVVKQGISATHFKVHVDGDDHHDHHHHHPHRHLGDVLEIIAGGDLPAPVREAAGAVFQRIGECEAQVHGVDINEVHFHEVGAVDSIVDIVAGTLAMHLLGVERVYASSLHVGAGTVHAAHGVMPVPAPATALLLQGIPCYGGEVQGELVTPTGAALIAHYASEYGPMPEMSVSSIGYGAGTREFKGRANVLRVMVGEVREQRQGHTVTLLETTVDDMNPELFPPLMAKLLASGARDAFLTPVLGKKGRPAYLLTVMCDEDRHDAVAQTIFEGTSTFGIRYRTERRFCLERVMKKVSTPWGKVSVKVGTHGRARTAASPEFEDCWAVAENAGVSVRAVYEAALAAAVKGELSDE